MFGYMMRTIVLLSTALAAQVGFQAPKIMLHDSLEAALGSKVTIDCVAQANPRPKVTLYRNDVFIPGQEAATFSALRPNLGAATYTFTAVQGSGGPYECRATNGIADVNGTMVITKVINVIITGLSSTTTTARPPTTAVIITSIDSLSTAPPTANPTIEKKTDPTNSVTTKKTVKPDEEKTTVSGSNSSSALSLLVVFLWLLQHFLSSIMVTIDL